MDRKTAWLERLRGLGAVDGDKLVLPKGVKELQIYVGTMSEPISIGKEVGGMWKMKYRLEGDFIRTVQSSLDVPVREGWYLVEDIISIRIGRY